ncbi:MFS general substrate transporter [Annulohypoxylon maeteangense]|uniref:MFS general substrate transporter n=1 Tax=Annulohypoxylon maeteangense TaxID=1927788 RepID=UPI002008B8E9|nr:MFS general substrate transporter [Annulohypoxylon maeteangense]KAI0881355.1 MFS general substrate transporter [Annulohypoxylon maeteangense]
MEHDPARSLADVGFYPESAPETPYLGLDTSAFPSGVASPDPLLTPSNNNNDYFPLDRTALAQALGQNRDSSSQLSIRMQTRDITDRTHHDDDDDEVLPDLMLELSAIRSRTRSAVAAGRIPDIESGSSTPVRTKGRSQGVPPELPNFAAEVIFVLVCTAGQFIFALTYGHANVAQLQLRTALGLPATQIPWVLGSGLLASGLSVIVAGSLADLAAPKPLMVGAFIWSAVWHAVAAAALSPRLKVLFFVARAMQGLSQGVLVSASMSILGRVYKPGVRKTRVFSLMAAGAPFGFSIGCLHGGALSSRLPWLFGSTAIFLGVVAIAAHMTLPDLSPAKDSHDVDAPSLRQFDYVGALLSSTGCGLVLFGLTQGSSANWNPYTYSLIIAGVLMFVAFAFVERSLERPLIPNGLWKTPGFAALLVAYFLGFGGFTGAWQFYAVQFWQRYQGATPITVALYILPNGIVGVLAAYIVSKTLHIFPGHWIFIASMIAFAIGPAFFLPQTPDTSYWALSFPGVALATFGPDMSFAAAAIFITSSVPRSYQGSAGALLVTVQNLTSAIMTSISDSIGVKVDQLPSGEIGLAGLKAIWWFGLASALTGAVITATFVRIPKAEEKEHVQ